MGALSGCPGWGAQCSPREKTTRWARGGPGVTAPRQAGPDLSGAPASGWKAAPEARTRPCEQREEAGWGTWARAPPTSWVQGRGRAPRPTEPRGDARPRSRRTGQRDSGRSKRRRAGPADVGRRGTASPRLREPLGGAAAAPGRSATPGTSSAFRPCAESTRPHVRDTRGDVTSRSAPRRPASPSPRWCGRVLSCVLARLSPSVARRHARPAHGVVCGVGPAPVHAVPPARRF